MQGHRSSGPPRGRRGDLITGRLQAHGRANYQFEPDGSPSYYLKLVTPRGVETLWGTDLERAITRSKTQPQIGAMVGARRVGSVPVTLSGPEKDPDRQQTFQRALWVVENVTWFAQSAQQARLDMKARLEDARAMTERPELCSAFISLSVAERFAEQNIRDPRDRELFVSRVKAVMAASVSNGKPVPEPRLVDGRRASPDCNEPSR